MDQDFITWIREVINPQAAYGNNVCLGDYTKDGNSEYLYPVEFTVYGDKYRWFQISKHTKGRHLTNHQELHFIGRAFNAQNGKIATGPLTKTKMRKGLKAIYNYYKEGSGQP